VAGIGNVFQNDDGFGPEIARHVMARLEGNEAVRIVDYGIRGMHLAYDLLEKWDALVLIDAIPNRGSPGTLHVFEADLETLAATAGLEAHSMDPAAVFSTLHALDGVAPYTVVVGCEVDDVDEGMGLSDAVSAAVADAVRAVEDLVARLLVSSAPSAQGG
jgi:hydrogenase maturation protease